VAGIRWGQTGSRPLARLVVVVLMMAGCAAQGPDQGSPLPLAIQPVPMVGAPRRTSIRAVHRARNRNRSTAVSAIAGLSSRPGSTPANPQVASGPPPPVQPPQGGLFQGALGGVALGAVGGAIGGNAGEGAAIGAGVGALFGAMRRARWAEEQQQAQTACSAQPQTALAASQLQPRVQRVHDRPRLHRAVSSLSGEVALTSGCLYPAAA